MGHWDAKHAAVEVLTHYCTFKAMYAFVGLQCNNKLDLNAKSSLLAIKRPTIKFLNNF